MDLFSISISNYKTYREERKSGKSKKSAGGHVVVFVHSTINLEKLTSEGKDVFELLWSKPVINGTIFLWFTDLSILSAGSV